MSVFVKDRLMCLKMFTFKPHEAAGACITNLNIIWLSLSYLASLGLALVILDKAVSNYKQAQLTLGFPFYSWLTH